MTAFSKSRRLRDRRGGTTVLEVAVVLPVFFTFVFGLIEYGRVQMVANVVKNACRQGARYRVGGIPESSSGRVAR